MSKASQLKQTFTAQLKEIYTLEEALTLWNWTWEDILGKQKMQLLMYPDQILSASEIDSVNATIERLLHHEPIQYISGIGHFLGNVYHVSNEVLIPRQETEELVQHLIAALQSKQQVPLKLYDFCTGSGCIAITLARIFPIFKVFGVDISEGALEIAQKNDLKIPGNPKVNWEVGDLLNPAYLNALPEMDVIVSNPPYVTHAEKASMKPGVLDYEPHLALFVPDNDPLVFYKSMIQTARQKLVSGGLIAFEINESLETEMRQLFQHEPFSGVELMTDLNGKPRMLFAQKL